MWNKLLFLFFLTPAVLADYCQPDQTTCWPTQEDIDAFEANLSYSEDCLPQIPTFTSVDKQGVPIQNEWFADQPEIVTPYLMLNLRTFISPRMAYFVVLARTVEDVSESVLFATRHNLSISVMSTGHEFQDRNSGLSPNSLLIRTTCLRRSDFDLNPDNLFGHPDGVVKLGAGMTWGTSKLNMKGVHELAAEQGRVVVSGHAANVGIVGWSLGGGHGQLVPLHGMGVDQMLEVELVGPDGSVIVANADGTTMTSSDGKETHTTSNADLFWALRGGGGSTWGVIVSMTIKVHKPRNSCTKDCYTQRAWIWTNRFDDAVAEEMITNLLHSYLSWASQTSKYWSSYGIMIPGTEGEYYFLIGDALYVGSPEDEGDYDSFESTFRDLYPEKRIVEDFMTFDTFHEKTLVQDPEPINTVSTMINLLSVLMNGTTASQYDVAKRFVDNWIPRCFRQGTPCATAFQFHHTCASTYETVASDTAISSAFRQARIHVTIGDIFSIEEPDMSVEDKFKFVHDVLAPEMYQAGEGSYFSESEYTMDEWQTRLWGKENYDRLASVKQVWDPTHVFGCRHCIGDGLEPQEISNETMPPWRRNVF